MLPKIVYSRTSEPHLAVSCLLNFFDTGIIPQSFVELCHLDTSEDTRPDILWNVFTVVTHMMFSWCPARQSWFSFVPVLTMLT